MRVWKPVWMPTCVGMTVYVDSARTQCSAVLFIVSLMEGKARISPSFACGLYARDDETVDFIETIWLKNADFENRKPAGDCGGWIVSNVELISSLRGRRCSAM